MSVNKIKHIIIIIIIIIIFWPYSMCYLSSLTRAGTGALCIENSVLNPLDCQGSPNTFILMAMK